MLMNDDMTGEDWKYLGQFFVPGRSISTSVFFGIGLLTVGVSVWKCLVICALVYFLHSIRLGVRRIEQLGLILLALGILSWTNILPVQSMLANIKSEAAIALAQGPTKE
jgi:hypothetical protein